MKKSIFSKMLVMLCVVSLLATTFCFVPTFAADEATNIVVDSVDAAPGTTAVVPVSITNGTACEGFVINLTYDATKLSITKNDIQPSTQLGQLINQGDAFYEANLTTGNIRLAIASTGSSAGLTQSDAKTALFNFTFTVNAAAEAGNTLIDATVISASDPDGALITDSVSATDGYINIRKGDVDLIAGSAQASTTGFALVPFSVKGASTVTSMAFDIKYDPTKISARDVYFDQTLLVDGITTSSSVERNTYTGFRLLHPAGIAVDTTEVGTIHVSISSNDSSKPIYSVSTEKPLLTVLFATVDGAVSNGDQLRIGLSSVDFKAGSAPVVTNPLQGAITAAQGTKTISKLEINNPTDSKVPNVIATYVGEYDLAGIKALLGSEVKAEYTDTSSGQVDVVWDDGISAVVPAVVPVAGSSYDPTKSGEYTFTGTVVNEPDVSNAQDQLTFTVKVTLNNRVLKSVNTVTKGSVNYGTSAATLLSKYLPSTVSITTDDKWTGTADVSWNVAGFDPYASNVIQNIYGTLDLPVGVVQSSTEIKALAQITVKAQGSGDSTGGNGGGVVITPPDNKHLPYMNGYTDGTVKPDASITRAEVAAILHRVMKNEDSLTDPVIDANHPTFNDLDSTHWAFKDVEVLVRKGILNGYSDGSFRPDAKITRAEFAKVISLYKHLSTSVVSSNYVDVSADNWAKGYIDTVTLSKYMLGYGGGEFRPDNNLTRAEIATTVNRVLKRVPSKEKIDAIAVNPYSDLSHDHWAYYEIMEASLYHQFTIVGGVENWFKLL